MKKKESQNELMIPANTPNGEARPACFSFDAAGKVSEVHYRKRVLEGAKDTCLMEDFQPLILHVAFARKDEWI